MVVVVPPLDNGGSGASRGAVPPPLAAPLPPACCRPWLRAQLSLHPFPARPPHPFPAAITAYRLVSVDDVGTTVELPALPGQVVANPPGARQFLFTAGTLRSGSVHTLFARADNVAGTGFNSPSLNVTT